MHDEKRGIEESFWFIIILLPLLMIPAIVFGGETDKYPKTNSERQGNYVLTVKDDLISLKARDASFKEILEDIGCRMNIEVAANISEEEKITIEFEMMPLGEAVKRFRTSYAYVTKSEEEKGKITKLVIAPKGLGKGPSNKLERDPQPSIREFEYNPQPAIKEFEYNPQPSIQKEP